jgi:hypothetical protein
MSIQNNRGDLKATGESVRITVEGEGWLNVPFPLFLTVDDPNVRLSRIELDGLVSGSYSCNRFGELTFFVVMRPEEFSAWHANGSPEQDTEGHMAVVRAVMMSPTGSSERAFPLMGSMQLRTTKANAKTYYAIFEGQC